MDNVTNNFLKYVDIYFFEIDKIKINGIFPMFYLDNCLYNAIIKHY